jgi:hypothetical protein
LLSLEAKSEVNKLPLVLRSLNIVTKQIAF